MIAAVITIALATDQPATVREEHDIAYAAAADDQKLDLYAPAGRRGFPVVIFIHGGSLQAAGERRTSPAYSQVCPRLSARGIGCVTIDYRLAPPDRWPSMPQDVAAAVKWVKQNIAARGGDPTRVFLFGHSSGCLLAAVLAANPVYLSTAGLSPADLAGVIPMGCALAPSEEATIGRSIEELKERWSKRRPDNVYSTLDDWLSADPSRFIGPHVPPVLVVLAERERFFPAILEQGAKFVRRLLEIKRPANVVIVPGGHMDSIGRFGADGDPAVAAVEAFIRDPGAFPKN